VLALTVLLIIALIGATWVEITTHERQQATEAAARRQGNLSISVTQYLARALGNADAVAQYLSGVHASASPYLEEQLFMRARANTLFSEMWICMDDDSLLSTGVARDFSERARQCAAWRNEAPAGARSYAGLPVRAGTSIFVPLLTRVPASADRPAGVIALLVEVRNLLGLLQEYSMPDETVVLVAGADGVARARWHSTLGMADQRAPEAMLLPAVLGTGTPGQMHTVEGRPVLATARSMDAYLLTVLITTKLADTLAEPHARSFYYGVAGAAATVLIIMFALLLLALQNRSVVTAESLGRARQRLQALNDELEEQVRERTGELEAAYRDLEAFSYTVAHDVRAPIAAIQGFAEALAPAVEATGLPKASHYLRRIVANATQMNELTDSLLTLGKLSRPPVEAVRIDLTAMAHDVLVGLRERGGASGAAETCVQNGLFVLGDPVLVRQVLENLLGNAWKFSAARNPPVIHVGGTRGQGDEAGWITIAIRDNGEGFDQASAVGLFKPFRRMHAPGAFPGTGVGLAAVERILRHHGGRVWIESSPQQGTTVFFRMRAEP